MARELIQDSFFYGEVSQALQASPTKEQYRSSVARNRNMVCLPDGSLTRRQGTQHVCKIYPNSGNVNINSKIATYVTQLGTELVLIFPQNDSYDVTVINPAAVDSVSTVDFSTLIGTLSHCDTNAALEAFNNIRFKQIGDELCFGFMSNMCFTFKTTITEGSVPVISGIAGGYRRFESYDPETTLTPPTITVTPVTSSSTAVGKRAVVYTAYNENTGAERFIKTELITGLSGYSATDYITFETSAIPSGYTAIKVYLANSQSAQAATLLGFINATGSGNKLLYIGQPTDSSQSWPLDKLLVSEGLEGTYDRANRASAVAFFQQRLIIGGLTGFVKSGFTPMPRELNKIAFSYSRQPFNFNQYAIELNEEIPFYAKLFDIGQVNHLVEHKRLLGFTDRGVVPFYGQEDGVLSKSSMVVGSKNNWVSDYSIQPCIAGNHVFFSTNDGTKIIRATFSREINGYEYKDVTGMFRDVLEDGERIDGLSFSPRYNNIVWSPFKFLHYRYGDYVPSQKLLGLSIYEGSEAVGCHVHDLGGEVVDIASGAVLENSSNTYVLTRRKNIFRTYDSDLDYEYYLEKFLPANVYREAKKINAPNNFYLDFVRHTLATRYVKLISGTVGELSTGTTWDAGETITFTSNDNAFVPTVGNKYRFSYGNFSELYWDAECLSTDGDLVHTFESDMDVPEEFREVNLPGGTVVISLRNTYTIPFSHIGLSLALVADNTVVYHPFLPDYEVLEPETEITVDLNGWYDVISIGVPFISEVLTHRYADVQREDHTNKIKSVVGVDLCVKETRNVRATGASLDTLDTIGYDDMDEIRYYDHNFVSVPESGKFNITTRGDWDRNGQVLLRQYYPDPFTLLAVHTMVDE